MNDKFIMITLNPFNLNQLITVHTPDVQYTLQHDMDNVFNAALAVGEEQGIYDIKIATVSFPKQYSEELAHNARTTAITKYGENKFNIEVLA